MCKRNLTVKMSFTEISVTFWEFRCSEKKNKPKEMKNFI